MCLWFINGYSVEWLGNSNHEFEMKWKTAVRSNLRYHRVNCLGGLRKTVEVSGRIASPAMKLESPTYYQSAKYACDVVTTNL